MRAETPLHELPMHFFRRAPPLRRAQQYDGPARLHDGVSGARSLLDVLDLGERPVERGGEVMVDVGEVFDEARLVTVAGEERDELFVVHAPVDGALADLEAVDVHDREHCAGFAGVEVFVAVPGAVDSSCQRNCE